MENRRSVLVTRTELEDGEPTISADHPLSISLHRIHLTPSHSIAWA
jgi:hypothetical protein